MQNDRQSSETVILGVDTHLDIHVGAVISRQVNCLELTLFKQIKRAIWNYLIGHVLSVASNEQASKEQEHMVPH